MGTNSTDVAEAEADREKIWSDWLDGDSVARIVALLALGAPVAGTQDNFTINGAQWHPNAKFDPICPVSTA